MNSRQLQASGQWARQNSRPPVQQLWRQPSERLHSSGLFLLLWHLLLPVVPQLPAHILTVEVGIMRLGCDVE